MSDNDSPSRTPAAVAPATAKPSAGTVLGAAVASPAAYTAATAQEAATALVRMLMEQMVLGPGAVGPETRADGPARRTGSDDGPAPQPGPDAPGEPPPTWAPNLDDGKVGGR
ncbi:hypothetical protein ACIRIR_34650 [Streptomyces globisporus]|uniref:hypothetical protein n=1 Tax=Streptomyces globisporus TaxID=1908 RepID=UPI00382E2554